MKNSSLNTTKDTSVKRIKKYYASFPNGIKIEITKEYAEKILWFQKIFREQRAKVKSYGQS